MPRNQVRGPSSALSSFLRERGITAPTNTFQSLRRNEQVEEEAEENIPTNSTEIEQPAIIVPERPRASKSRRKVEKKNDSDESDDLVKSKRKKRPRVEHDSSCKFCERCKRRYIDSGSKLCQACQILSQSVSKSSKKNVKKREKLAYSLTGESQCLVLPLRDLCIKLIAECINDVEEFGNLPDPTKIKIAKIISKQRKLDDTTLDLFLGPLETRLELYDCTRLLPSSLLKIPYFCPNLVHLKLDMCGRMTDTVLETIGQSCKLQVLDLKGPFLCSAQGFSSMFKLLPSLKSFVLHFGAKFSNASVNALFSNCPSISTFELEGCPLVTGEGVSQMIGLESLTLNNIGEFNDEDLVKALNPNLVSLSISGQQTLTDAILEHVAKLKLKTLELASCPQLTNEGYIGLFTELNPLETLNLDQNLLIDDSVIMKLMETQKELKTLHLNGLDGISGQAISDLASVNLKLEMIDVSWIRVDDNVMETILKRPDLKFVRAFGCNEVTACILDKQHKNSHGKYIRIIGNEFD